MEFHVFLESIGIVFTILLGVWGLLRGLRRDRESEIKERIERATKINSICTKLDLLRSDMKRVWVQVDNHIPTMIAGFDARLTCVEEKVDGLTDKE